MALYGCVTRPYSCTHEILASDGTVTAINFCDKNTYLRQWACRPIMCTNHLELISDLHWSPIISGWLVDYSYLCKLFHDLFIYEGYQGNYVFDWSVQRMRDDGSAGTSGQKVTCLAHHQQARHATEFHQHHPHHLNKVLPSTMGWIQLHLYNTSPQPSCKLPFASILYLCLLFHFHTHAKSLLTSYK